VLGLGGGSLQGVGGGLIGQYLLLYRGRRVLRWDRCLLRMQWPKKKPLPSNAFGDVLGAKG